MSLDSSLYLDATLGPENVRTCLLQTGYFAAAPDFEKGLRLTAEGTLVTIFHRSPMMGPFEDAGIEARRHLFFANSDKENTAAWTLNTVRAVACLLERSEGDALFLYCSDSPALLRKAGELILDERCGLWQRGVEPDVLPLIELPYRFGIIPVT